MKNRLPKKIALFALLLALFSFVFSAWLYYKPLKERDDYLRRQAVENFDYLERKQNEN